MANFDLTSKLEMCGKVSTLKTKSESGGMVEISWTNGNGFQFPNAVKFPNILRVLLTHEDQEQLELQHEDNLNHKDKQNGQNHYFFTPNVLQQISNLTELDISGNKLEILPNSFSIIKKLKVLNLCNNELQELPESLLPLDQLTVILVNQNKLKVLPEWLQSLKQLQELHASSNHIANIPDWFDGVEHLRVLRMSFNELRIIPQCMSRLSNLVVLDVRNNKIDMIEPDVLKSSKTLLEVDLSYNIITKVPLWFKDLTNIKKLSISGNALAKAKFFFESKKPLTSLNEFHMRGCDFFELPLFLSKFPSLQVLYAGNDSKKQINGGVNMISAISPELSQLKHLRKLNLANGRMSDIPDNICNLSNLEIIDLSDNTLFWFSDGVCKLQHLHTLILTNNPLMLLPSDFGNLKSLRRLLLNNNKITELPDSFAELENLEYLDLYENQLQEFPAVIVPLPKLMTLDVGHNEFEKEDIKLQISDEYYYKYCEMSEKLRSQLPPLGLLQPRDDCKIISEMTKQSELYEQNSTICSLEDDELVKSAEQWQDNWSADKSAEASKAHEEDWDSDEYFDPNFHQLLESPHRRKNVKQFHYTTLGHQAFGYSEVEEIYCPADDHVESIPRFRLPISHCEDGQFDDTDEEN